MLEKVRAAISDRLSALGAHDVTSIRETILIRQGLFCGRKFECDGFQVVWFVEENHIKIFGSEGRLIEAMSAERLLSLASEPVRRAA